MAGAASASSKSVSENARPGVSTDNSTASGSCSTSSANCSPTDSA
jgi:hypothetical protein